MDRLSIQLSLIRIRLAHRKRRMDAGNYTEEPASWITLKSNGEHVPLNEEGVAIGGAGGWAKGKNFSKAKSTKAVGKGKKPADPAAKGGDEGKTPEKPLGKQQLKESLDTSRQKCSDLEMRMKKFRLNPDNSDALWEREMGTKYLAMAEKFAKEKKAELDAVKQAIHEQEAKEGSREKLEKELQEWNDRTKHIQTEMDKLPPDSEEYSKKKAEHMEAWGKAWEINEKLRPYEDEERLTKELAEDNSKVDMYRENLEKVRKDKTVKEYEAMEAEYEKAAKQRDDSILAMYKSAADCKTSDDANDYLRAKGFFRKDGESALDSDAKVDIADMADEHARVYAEHVEKIMEDYPWMKGKMTGFDCHDFSNESSDGALGYESEGTVCISLAHFGKPELVPESKRKNGVEDYKMGIAFGHAPKGTTYASVVDHEFTHAMEEVMQRRADAKKMRLHDGRIGNEVMKRVQEKLYGSYSEAMEDKVRKAVSGYAHKNYGIDPIMGENPGYGRNTEFIAEAMSEARTSKTPRKVALAVQEAMEELMKELELM